MDITKDGNFTWSTKNETGKLADVVEQYRWNKWIKVGEVDGNGSADDNKYEFKITPHSGENKFRVKQVDYSSKPRYSQASRYISTSGEISFSLIKAKDIITFTGETLLEVYDSFGNSVKKGFGEKVDVTNLKKGIYYLNHDNKTDTFVKK